MVTIKKFVQKELVKQSNNLVEAKYKLKPVAQRVMLAIASQVNKNGDSFDPISFRARDLLEFIGCGEENYSRLKDLLRYLRKQEIQIHYKDKQGRDRTRYTGWIKSFDAHDEVKNGIIDVEIDDRLKNDMLNLKSAYFKAPIENLIQLKKEYSARLFMYLRKSYDTAIRLHKYSIITVESKEIKQVTQEAEVQFFIERFMLPKSYEQKFINFRKKFLEPCLEEINKKTNIAVEKEYIKEGRAYKKIRFTITGKDEVPLIQSNAEAKKEEAPAALPAPDPKPEELSPEKKKYVEKLHEIGLEPLALCEHFARERSVGALRFVCRVWKDSQESYSPLGGGWVRKMLSPDESGGIPAEIEAEEIQRKYNIPVKEEQPKGKGKELDLDKLPEEAQELDFAKTLRKRGVFCR